MWSGVNSESSTWSIKIVSQQTMTAYSQRAASNLHGKDFVSLHVVVDRAPIYIDDLRRACDPNDFHILRATRAPYFFTENERRLRLRRIHD